MTLLDRFLGRPAAPPPVAAKAVGGPGVFAYYRDQPLSLLTADPVERAAAYLRAYKCGWFYKAERKISADIAGLDWSISDGDAESTDPAETIIERPDLDIEFDALNPVQQLIRLLERPNPFQTGKQLLQKTQIRKDMAGWAFWYLENGDGGAIPTAIYGISPARMTPSRDRNGQLIGWVMDKDKPQGGVPFSVDEIVAFTNANADDDDTYGVGVVEAVYAELPLTDLMTRHTSDLLMTGGRLAGMISPKDRALTEDEYNDALKAWRNIASDGNAARRLLVFPEPMEYSAGASTPAEIGIPELAALNRDNILTAFPISPYQLGVPIPGGLNSGEVRREDRRDYWEGTIHPRVDDLEEVIQVKLVARYERVMGQTFDFDIEEPNLDDAESLIAKVAAYKELLETGFDDTEARSAAGLDHIKYVAVPALLDPVQQAAAAAAAATAAAQAPQMSTTVSDNSRAGIHSGEQIVSKGGRRAAREAATMAGERVGKTELERFFDTQRTRIMTRIAESLPREKAARKADPAATWWDQEQEDAALRTSLRNLYLKIGYDSLQIVADELGRVVLSGNTRRILTDLVNYGGDRITGINEATRDAVKAQLAEGVRRGYSINQLIDGVPAENYAGVAKATLDNGVGAFDAYRAEVIARTETALSFNRASIGGYAEFGIKEVQAIDGDGDEQCAERDGRIFDVSDAYGIEDHPNGTLDWVPVIPGVDDKSADHLALALKALEARTQPVVNVTVESAKAPEVTIPVNVGPTPVTIESPVVNVETPTVNVTNEVVSPSVTVQNEVKTPSVTVTNEVVTPTVNVAAPDVHVTNEVVTPVVNVTNESPAVHVTNEVVTPVVNVEPAVVNLTLPDPEPRTREVKRDETGRIIGVTEWRKPA